MLIIGQPKNTVPTAKRSTQLSLFMINIIITYLNKDRGRGVKGSREKEKDNRNYEQT